MHYLFHDFKLLSNASMRLGFPWRRCCSVDLGNYSWCSIDDPGLQQCLPSMKSITCARRLNTGLIAWENSVNNGWDLRDPCCDREQQGQSNYFEVCSRAPEAVEWCSQEKTAEQDTIVQTCKATIDIPASRADTMKPKKMLCKLYNHWLCWVQAVSESCSGQQLVQQLMTAQNIPPANIFHPKHAG